MRKPLTVKTLEALKPQAKRYMVHDAHCPGLAVRVSENGHKVLVVNYRYGLEQCRETLGPYPVVTLAEAREKAIAIFRQMLEVSNGVQKGPPIGVEEGPPFRII